MLSTVQSDLWRQWDRDQGAIQRVRNGGRQQSWFFLVGRIMSVYLRSVPPALGRAATGSHPQKLYPVHLDLCRAHQ